MLLLRCGSRVSEMKQRSCKKQKVRKGKTERATAEFESVVSELSV